MYTGEEEDAFAVDTPEEKPVLSRHSRPQSEFLTETETLDKNSPHVTAFQY